MDDTFEDKDDYDQIYKLVLIGDSGVGKSNLLSRWATDEFSDESRATIGVEFATRTVIYDKKKIKAQIWDTAGQERYRAITSAYYRGAVGALIVYDITNKKSFDNVGHWIDQLHQYIESDISIVMVGNKSDLESMRSVPIELAKQFADSKKILFLEASARDNNNVDDAYTNLISGIYEKKQNNTEIVPIGISAQKESNKTILTSGVIVRDEFVVLETKNKCCSK